MKMADDFSQKPRNVVLPVFHTLSHIHRKQLRFPAKLNIQIVISEGIH